MKPRLLDLFCGAGGASMGYQLAGFHVTGVDIAPQPNYCGDEFVQEDALELLAQELSSVFMDDFDAVHASPPCQAHVKGLAAVNVALGRGNPHRDLIGATRKHIVTTGLPYVIENVEGSPLLNPIRLCGSSFGLAVRRHRLFECSFSVMAHPCAHHLQNEERYWTSWRPDGEHRLAKVVQVYGNAPSSEWAAAMGIDWMTRDELREAIPPAYTEHIGGYLMAAVRRASLATAEP